MSTASGRRSGRIWLEALLVVTLIGILAWFLFPRKSDKPEQSKTNPAVQRVMDIYAKLADKYLKARPETSPAEYASAMGELCDVLERQDMSDCPKDFQLACAHNIRAIRDGQAALRRCPNGFLEGVAMGATNHLVRGEADGGLTRLEGDIKEAMSRIRTTSDEVERIGAKYTD